MALALTGCEPFPADRVGFQLVGEDLVIVPCRSIEATTIIMEVDDESGALTRFYEVSGPVSVSKGDEFSTAPGASAPPGTSIRFTPELDPGSDIYVAFASADDSIISYLTLGEAGIPSDGWLQPDGTVSEWPCGYKRATRRPPSGRCLASLLAAGSIEADIRTGQSEEL